MTLSSETGPADVGLQARLKKAVMRRPLCCRLVADTRHIPRRQGDREGSSPDAFRILSNPFLRLVGIGSSLGPVADRKAVVDRLPLYPAESRPLKHDASTRVREQLEVLDIVDRRFQSHRRADIARRLWPMRKNAPPGFSR